MTAYLKLNELQHSGAQRSGRQADIHLPGVDK